MFLIVFLTSPRLCTLQLLVSFKAIWETFHYCLSITGTRVVSLGHVSFLIQNHVFVICLGQVLLDLYLTGLGPLSQPLWSATKTISKLKEFGLFKHVVMSSIVHSYLGDCLSYPSGAYAEKLTMLLKFGNVHTLAKFQNRPKRILNKFENLVL